MMEKVGTRLSEIQCRAEGGVSATLKSSTSFHRLYFRGKSLSHLKSALDHLVVVAGTLEEGRRWCAARLGVAMANGGSHVRMGTHNKLLNIGNGIYLEAIAVDPGGNSPVVPRWFGMDSPLGRKLAAEGPRLASFVVATNNIQQCVEAVPALGTIHHMQRGALEWQITIPENGELGWQGALPAVIQWPEGVHPTASMADSGCDLERLEVLHPDAENLSRLWSAIGFADSRVRLLPTSGAPGLRAILRTPSGERTIDGANAFA
jgi:hypothetical protein